jgi:adenylyltransferase/sulfurtransferase
LSGLRAWLGQLFGRRAQDREPPARTEPPRIVELEPAEAERMLGSGGDLQVLDVRFPHEHQVHRIEKSILIPLPELSARTGELDPSRPTLVYCEHGMRSQNACELLAQLGFGTLYSLAGGMSEYSRHLANSKG